MSVAEQLKFVRLELDTFETLDKKRIIEKPRLWASQREYARLQGKREGLLGSIAEVEKKIGETRQQALTLIDNRKQENYEKLTETQEKLAKSIQEERNAQDILSRLKILAPLAGTVVGLQEHTIGGVISPGKPILDIVPSESEFIVEARISPADIDAVHPGLATKVQLSAYKQRIPWVTGKVITVSANTFFEQQTNMTYYTSRIKISPKDIKQLKNVILYPGMPVEVMIITNNRSPLQYLLSPVRNSFNRAFREE
jgi:HlyD family secretion protein/epimerase transport system membrane fusion protein